MSRAIFLVLAFALAALEPVPSVSQENRAAPPENRVPADRPPAGGNELSRPDLPQFGSLDTDRDASISRTEARGHAGLDAIFAECDSDRDGKLSAWEFAEARQKLLARAGG